MVGIVSGIRSGLELGSREVLGQAGLIGNATAGRNSEGVYVNVANGMLVVQNRDELLVGRGEDAALLRTYNSAGQFNDDNGDGWASGIASLRLTGAVNAPGSSIARTDRDGGTAIYNFDAARGLYITTEGAGAHDTISYVAGVAPAFEWRDGTTGLTQRYEGSGAMRLLSCADPAGNVLTYAYGANGFLSSVSTANGDATLYDYVGSNLMQVRTVSGTVTTTRVRYFYDPSNRLDNVVVDLSPSDNAVADGNVYRTTYTYDGASKRIATITQTDGSSLALTYVDAGGGNFKVASLSNALGQTTTFAYGVGFTTVTDAQGFATRYDVDASGQLTKITRPSAAGVSPPTQQFGYNANGDVLWVRDGEGRTVSFGYDANGNQTLQRDQTGNTITRTFDARNQLVTESMYLVADPDGGGVAQPAAPLTTRHVYDASGRNQLRFTISPEGRVTEHRYDSFGQRVASVSYSAGRYATTSLAANAAPSESDMQAWASLQNPAATQRVDMVYDARGQLQSRITYATVGAAGAGVVDGTQSVQTFVYDQAGLLLKTVSGTGGVTSYTYDGLGRVLASVDAAGATTLTQYADALGKTILTLANGLVRTSAYDKAGRLVAVAEGNSAGAALGTTKYFYDAGDHLRMTQDPTGVQRFMLYDDAGRKTAEIDGTGTMTEYTYDASDRLTYSVRYANGVIPTPLLDASGLPVASASAATVRPLATPGDQREWRSYDVAGRLLRTATNYGAGGTVAVTENRYDGASRLIETVRYANPLTADTPAVMPGAIAAPVASADDRSSRSFYDADGLLLGTLDAEGFLTGFMYTAAGQLAQSVRYATATPATLRASGTLAQLTPAAAAGDARTTHLYDGKGQRIATIDAEGYLTESVYDNSGNVTKTVRYANRVGVAVTSGSALAAIRPASSAQDRTTSRAYDTLNRVAQETSPEGLRTTYTYDKLGNVVSTLKTAVLPEETRSLLAQYDLQGRRVAELSAQGSALLTAGQTQAQVDAIWAQYGARHTYDAAGRRTSTTDAAGNRTLFYYNGDSALSFVVNALGEVTENGYDSQDRLLDQIAYTGRISTTGLSGGFYTPTLGAALATISGTQVHNARYRYTSDDRVAATIDGLGNVTRTAYNAFGDEVSSDEQIAAGQVLSRTYAVDRRGLRTGATVDPASAYGLKASSFTTYDAFGRAVRSVDANGNVREQAFDRLGRVVSTRDASNAVRGTSYDAFDRVLTETDALGRVTTYGYDPATRTVSITTPEGIRTATTYTRHGQVQSITDGKGQVTTYTYDRNGNLQQTSNALATTRAAFDGAGRQIETTDANGIRTAYTYDAASRVLTRRVDPNGLNLTTTYGYDGRGQQVSVTDANGVVTTRSYDARGRVLREVVDPAGLNLQTVYTYDARDNVLTVATPGGAVTQYVYDALGRRVQERVDPAGLNLTRNWSYDRNGNAVSATDALGNVTRYAFDAENRLVFTVDPLGSVRQNAYDSAGRVVKTVAYVTPISLIGLSPAPTVAEIQPRVQAQSAQDRVEHRVYDRDGRLTATVDGNGAVVKTTYDANGNVVNRTAYANNVSLATWIPGTTPAPVPDPRRDETTSTVYDALNRAVYTVDGAGGVVARTYDGNGNVLQRRAYAVEIPTTTPLTEGAIALATAAVANPGSDALTRNVYDAANRLTWTANGIGAVTQRVYDRNGNVVRQVEYASGIAATAAPSSVLASASDRATSMAYDSANRLVLTVDALRAVKEQVYDADGRVVRRVAYANAIASLPALGTAATAGAIRALVTPDAAADRSTWFGYDASGRQALRIDALGAASEMQYDAAGNLLAEIGYATRSAGTGTLTGAPSLAAMKALVTPSPSADRVTRHAYDAAGRVISTIDAVGNRVAKEYNALGQLVRTTRYAEAGRIGADQVDLFGYNAAGQLVRSTDALGAAEVYGYDAVGRKVSFTNKKGVTWVYAYDAGGRMVSETAPSVSLTTVTADLTGTLVSGTTASAQIITLMRYDALGNLIGRTEAAGRPEERTTSYQYDSLGRQVRVVHPEVGVYTPALDNETVNGAVGVATPTETRQPLQTWTVYDTLGNAVASRDVGDGTSQKVYDLLGRVVYDVDAMGYVTGYTRNAFGEVTGLVRYATATSLANTGVSVASQAASRAQVEAIINALGADHSKDRTLLTTYDRAGRVVRTVEPTVFVYDSSAAAGFETGTTGKETRNTYDAFGQVVRVDKLRMRSAGSESWVTTVHYFDRAGRETATIDAMRHLTLRSFDAFGNLHSETEYATPVGGWTPDVLVAPATSQEDRTTEYAYDALNRKVAETRVGVEYSTDATGASTRGAVTTRFGYDAVGNQTSVTDAEGATTFTYYDALGRVVAVAAPTRSNLDTGEVLTPLTEFRRDAYGNAVIKVEYAKIRISPTPATYDLLERGDPTDDRVTFTRYDLAGRATQTTNANGANEFWSYDAYGHVAKHWQGVTGNDGVTRTSFEVNVYDKLGQVREIHTPASIAVATPGSLISYVAQSTAGVVNTTLQYNAFGELTRKATGGLNRSEDYEYDNGGRLWRTNSGDGVDRIQLHDALGNVTAEIRSGGSGAGNLDIRGLVNAQAAHLSPSTRRVDIQRDELGRVSARIEAARPEFQSDVPPQEMPGAVEVAHQFTVANVLASAAMDGPTGFLSPGAVNSVALAWNSLSRLGSGDVRVYLEYRTPPANGGTLRTYLSGALNGDDHAAGATLTWSETSLTPDVGIGLVTRLVVYKKDLYGTWQPVIDQAPGQGGTEIRVGAPANVTTALKLEVRGAGAIGDTGWWSPALVNFGNVFRLDAAALGAGSFEYRVTTLGASDVPREVARGMLSPGPLLLNPITTPISYGTAGAGALAWAAPGAGYSQVFRYRPNGSTGAWSTLPVAPRSGGTQDGVDTSQLAGGAYQFELLWTLAGQGVPSYHAIGTFNVVPAVPSTWVPPVGLPNITGLALGTASVGGTNVPALVWNAAGATGAFYTQPGGTWASFAMDNSGQSFMGSTPVGVQKAILPALGPALYLINILVGSPPTALATANLTISATGAAPTLTVTTPPYTAGYWTTAVPAQYTVSVTTSPNSAAISASYTMLTQSAGANGDNRTVRPAVMQKVDRWGNVLWSTDPRSSNWKTTYRYNANNQLVEQTMPDVNGAISGSSPVSSIYYDRVGRQVAVKDARGYINGQKFDAAGNLVQEVHADVGVVTHAYNAFGEKVRTTDAIGNLVSFSYDKQGNLLTMKKPVAGVYQENGGGIAVWQRSVNITETWHYDQLGRKISNTNGNGETQSYTYDLQGNVLERWQPLGHVTRYAYDALGRKTSEVDDNGVVSSWSYDYFGQLVGHVDMGGGSYTYTYDNARQLSSRTSTRGGNITYGYDAAGQMTAIRDWVYDKITTYMYDQSGRKVRERVVQSGKTYQDNHLSYDAQGNLRDVADARAHVVMEYDAVGNRTRVYTAVNYQGIGGDTLTASDRYFAYNEMNRQTVVDAVDSLGNIGRQGHSIGYDKNGNRRSDYFWGQKVQISGTYLGLDAYGGAVYAPGATYSKDTGYTTEKYNYDDLNRLSSVLKDEILVDVRLYDGADRVVQSGPLSNLTPEYSRVLNEGLAPDQMIGTETRINRYSPDGRLMHQRMLRSDGTVKADMTWDPNESYVDGSAPALRPHGYDRAGNVISYVMKNWETGAVSQFSTGDMYRFESYQPIVIRGISTQQSPGFTAHTYDVNGYLTEIQSSQPNSNRTFVNDANGRALFVNQGGNIQRQLIANGEVLGIYGVGVDSANPSSGSNNNPNFANIVDFDFGYAKITGGYPAPTPGAYTVQAGDTLQSIAQGAYGDSALWYRIAEANGLASTNELKVGQTVTIPNRVSTIHNNDTTFKPYDPSKIEGDTTPVLAMPEKGGGCGGAGMILMIIVAVAVTVMTGGAGGVLAGSLSSVFGLTGGALSIATGAAAAALGSIASQAVGLATGTIQKFDWKSVGLSAVSAGVGAGVSAATSALAEVPGAVARAVATSVVTQGIAVVTGLQRRFDWRGVAASAAGAAAGEAAGSAMDLPADGGRPAGMGSGEFAAKLTAKGFAAGTTASVARGGRVVVQQVAVDAFGNALGSSLASAASGDSTRNPSSAEYENEMDRQSDAAYYTKQQSELQRTGGNFARMDGASYRGMPAVAPSLVNGLTFSEDAELRGLVNDPYRQRNAGDMAPQIDGPAVLDMGQARDQWVATGRKPIYDFGDPFEAGGEGPLAQVRVARGSSVRPAMVNGVSVNSKAEALLNAAAEGDISGMGNLYRDYKLLGALMNDGARDGTLKDLKKQLQDRLGVMRTMPSEEALGARIGIGSDGVARYDKADLIDRYADALRKVGLAQQGVIEVDYKNFEVRTIGNPKLTPAQYLAEVETRYQRAFGRGVELAEERYARGELRYPADMPKQLQVGLFADDFGRRALLTYHSAMGVPEGPGQIISLNRWSYDPGGTGLYIRNDVLVDLGPGQRYWVDGKSSLMEAQNSSKQFQTFHQYTATVRGRVATPQGMFEVLPNGRIGGRVR